MVDKDKIFQLFLDGKENIDDETKKEIHDFMNGPYAKIGMFVKLIQNHKIFHQKLEKFLKQENLIIMWSLQKRLLSLRCIIEHGPILNKLI